MTVWRMVIAPHDNDWDNVCENNGGLIFNAATSFNVGFDSEASIVSI